MFHADYVHVFMSFQARAVFTRQLKLQYSQKFFSLKLETQTHFHEEKSIIWYKIHNHFY